MSKEARLKEAEMYRVARNEVLKSDDPYIWIDREGMEMSLGILMDEIQEYIVASLRIDENPLRYLRRYFPDFIWTFHEEGDRYKRARAIESADYIWMTCFGFVFDDFITATERRRAQPRNFCYRPRGEKDPEEALRLKGLVPRVSFVIDGNDTDASTIIS